MLITAYVMRISDWSSDVCSSDLPSAEELAVEVDREHAPPLAEGHFLKAPAGLDPRIVDQNMHSAEPGDAFIEHRLNVLPVGDVGVDSGGATAFSFNIPDYLDRRSVVSRQLLHDHVGLRAAERAFSRPADPRRSARPVNL